MSAVVKSKDGDAARVRPRVTPVAAGVYRLETGRALTEANVYLVQAADSWVLIDTAWPKTAPLIKAAAASLMGSGARPAALLLTHFHPDHSGAAGELARTWHIPIPVHPDELRFARGGYDPAYAHPLDRWVVALLLRLAPPARLEAWRQRDSLEDVAVAFDPAAEPPASPAGSASRRRGIRLGTPPSSGPPMACSSRVTPS